MKLTLTTAAALAHLAAAQFDQGPLVGNAGGKSGSGGLPDIFTTLLGGAPKLGGSGGGFPDLGALLGGLTGAGAAAGAAGAKGAPPPLGGAAPAPAPAPAPGGAVAAPPSGLPDISGILGALGGGSALGGAGGLPDLAGLLGGFLGAGAGPTADAAPILATYTNAKTQVDKLGAAVQKLSNTTTSGAVVSELLSAGNDLISTLKQGTDKIKALNGKVDLISAAGFMQPGEALTGAAEAALKGLVDKKAVVIKAGGAAQVLQNLKDQREAVIALNTAINAKLPDLAQGIAAPMAQRPVAALEQAIQAFSAELSLPAKA